MPEEIRYPAPYGHFVIRENVDYDDVAQEYVVGSLIIRFNFGGDCLGADYHENVRMKLQ